MCAVFREGDNGQSEVWLVIQLYTEVRTLSVSSSWTLSQRRRGSTCCWTQTYSVDLVTHTFKDVVFIQKNTNKSTHRRRDGRGKHKQITVTKESLDTDVLLDLESKCPAGVEESTEE